MITIKARHSVFINLAVEEIFAYMSDLENLMDWSGVTIAIKKNSSEPMHVGMTMRSTMRFLGKWLDIAFEIVEYNPNRCISFKSIAGVTPSLFCYQFEPVADGGTTVSQEVVMNLTRDIWEPTAPMITSAIYRQLENDLLTLKDMLEARAFTCQVSD